MSHQRLVTTLLPQRATALRCSFFCSSVYAICLFLALLSSVYALDTITVVYTENAPYLITNGDQIEGEFYTRAEAAFARAGLRTQWLKMPPLRQFALLKKNTPALCAANWYDTPERRKMAYVSAAITHFPELVLISRVDDRRFADPTPLHALLDNELRMALGVGFSLGAELDALVRSKHLRVIYRHGEDLEMLKEVISERADYSFLFADQADFLLSKVEHKINALTVHKLIDMPSSGTAHLLCSFAVGRKNMDALDAALSTP